MDNRNLYGFITAAALLVVGIMGFLSREPFAGAPYWGYAAGGLGVILLGYVVWASRAGLRGGMRLRATRAGIQVAAMILIVTGILAVVELFSVKHYKRWDVTPGKFFSLSPKTVQLLDRLTREKRRIEFIAFVRTLDRTQVEDILQQYAHRTKEVTYRFVDLDANPRLAKRYDVDAYGTVVVVHNFEEAKESAQAAKKEEAKAAAPAAGPPAKKEDAKKEEEKKTFRSEKIYDLSENAVANAILKTIQSEQKKVYFVTGHGERPYAGTGREALSTLATGMRDDNYRLDDLLLLRQKDVPQDANIVVIASPKKDLEEPEVQALEAFIRRGGRLLVFLEPDSPRGRFTALLEPPSSPPPAGWRARRTPSGASRPRSWCGRDRAASPSPAWACRTARSSLTPRRRRRGPSPSPRRSRSRSKPSPPGRPRPRRRESPSPRPPRRKRRRRRRGSWSSATPTWPATPSSAPRATATSSSML
ncbi:MAG: GldG family protein [Candidatus Tectomicrobia bacterium]|nr:GldG family protein [Candidatus Tectomicrobia bacterium]